MEFNLKKAEVFDKITEKAYHQKSVKMRLDPPNRRIRLNNAGVNEMELNTLNKDTYFKFFRLGKNWFTAITNEASGYGFSLEADGKSGASIKTATVSTEIFRDFNQVSFYLLKTDHEYYGHPIYELLPIKAA